jgi:hypothetical protein
MKNAYLALMLGTMAWGGLPACGGSGPFSAIVPDARLETDVPGGAGPDASLAADASPVRDAPLAEAGQPVPPRQITIVPSTAATFAASVGQHSSPITFSIPNAGSAPAGPLAITIAGAYAADFKATATGCETIAPGDVCTISVVFTPSTLTAVPETATLVVAETRPDGAIASVPLIGTAYSYDPLQITLASGDLGSVLVGSTGTPVVFSLTNTGDSPSGPLAVSVSSSDFVIATDTCTAVSLAPRVGTCSVGIALRPATVGAKTATLTITDSNGNPAIKTLTGMGVPIALALDASIVASFDGGGSVDQSIDRQSEAPVGRDGGAGGAEVTQPGPIAVSVASIDLGNLMVGAAAPQRAIYVTAISAITDLSVQATGVDVTIDPMSSCTTALAAGMTCIVVVDFLAKSPGSKSDSIVISGGGRTISVAITAVAQNPAKLVINSSNGAFFAAVGTTSSPITFGVANTGDLGTGALSVSITGDNAVDSGANAVDFVATSDCLILAPLASCTVSIVFEPQAAGTSAEVATLTVTDTGAGGSAVSAALTGTAY